MTDPKPLIIELGKRYVARNGKVSDPVQKGPFPDYPFMANFEGHVRTFTDRGRIFFYCYPESYDLVAEYIEPPAVKPFTIEAGKRYRTRDGRVTGPIYKVPFPCRTHPFVWIENRFSHSYRSDGHFFCDNLSQEDLVAEYIEVINVLPVVHGAATVGAEPAPKQNEANELLERSRKFALAGDNMELYDAITVYLNKAKS